MAERKGWLWESHDAWYLKVYTGETKTRKNKTTGELYRDEQSGKPLQFPIQRAYRLGHKRDFISKDEIHAAADRKLLELRIVTSGSMARIDFDGFVQHWFLALDNWRPSTKSGYKAIWNKHIKGKPWAQRALWEYRTRDITELLRAVAGNGEQPAKATLQRIKAFLSIVFRHSINAGFRESNPVRDAMLPRVAGSMNVETGAYTLEEIRMILDRLGAGTAALCATALAAYAGLRRAEIAGLRWDDLDFDDDTISVSQTRWRQTISDPKSKASRNWVPIIPALRRELEAYKAKWRPEKPRHDEDGNEIADTALFPMDLVFLGRTTIREACERAKVEWRGWHAFRRGLASNLFALGASDLIVQRVLRHSKVIVTRESYIKLRDPKLDAAMAQLSREVAKFGAVKERTRRSTPRRPRKHSMGA